MEAIETYKISDTKELRIFQDELAESPRTAWDNQTIMVCFHRRYDLGDRHNYDKDTFESWDELKEQIEADYNILAIQPLYLYDHSGITISTTPFGCNWDSGQVGWIFIYNDAEESLAELFEDKLNQIIKAEVEEYDQYLRGDVYGFKLIDTSLCSECGKARKEVIDSCWGFYGDDIKENGILENLSEEDRKAVLQQV